MAVGSVVDAAKSIRLLLDNLQLRTMPGEQYIRTDDVDWST
ncbi:MAG: hypothetical protein ABF904_00045 [Ethanoligenens sp.]